MYSFEHSIFNFFAPFEKREDTYKDADDKGILQRYHEMLGADWDDNLIPLLEGMIGNTLVPQTMRTEFIPYLEYLYGIEPIVHDLGIRRAFVAQWFNIVKVKGTLRSYQLVLGLLGFTNVSIEELTFKQGFDSPVTFDDEQRVFDESDCQSCSSYTLHLSGSGVMTEELYNTIMKAVKLVEPINAKLYSIVYNGGEVTFTIFVENNGDLIYSVIGVQVDVKLLHNGDMTITSDDAQNYYLDNGNLLKNGN